MKLCTILHQLRMLGKFPHLHGCGPIEASSSGAAAIRRALGFRTFTGAAPLKLYITRSAEERLVLFPHLHGCGPIEA